LLFEHHMEREEFIVLNYYFLMSELQISQAFRHHQTY
jgi:hypothetical protein